MGRMRIDLHTHSNISDGTDSPTRLVVNAQMAGLDVVALTDHDTFDGVMEAREAGKRVGVEVMSGVEMSCEYQGTSVHLLGYGCKRTNKKLVAELARLRAGRSGRVEAMAERMTELGLPLSVDDIREQAGASPSVGRPHVADALIAKGYVADRDEAFDKYLADDKPGYVTRYSAPLASAVDLIHKAKGVAVIAHPWGRGTREVLTSEVLEQLVYEHHLDGIEVDHQDHDEATRELLFELGRRLGLIRTGSSDYHGTGKVDHDLGCNLTRPGAYHEIVRRIADRGGELPA